MWHVGASDQHLSLFSFIYSSLMPVSVRQYCLWIFLCVGPSSWWPDFSEGEWERLGLDGLWRETDHLEDLPDCRGKGRVHRKDPKLKTQVAKQNIHLLVQRVHHEKKKLEQPSQNLLDVKNVLWFFFWSPEKNVLWEKSKLVRQSVLSGDRVSNT